MFLTSIEIFGFKSFARRKRIEFNSGITAILGPNGCGKSNVVDALKWALGEQSAKTLRTEKMENIIFGGTEVHKALNVAEVAVEFSNSLGILPVDAPEIEIKRRLYRSGESEYYINKTPAKLKDIRELFADTGIGKSAYSVMEQGRIDQILSCKPEERRYLFEEAAGITKYRIRKTDAERKLTKTEENIRQVEGILGEVRKRHDSLKAQAEKSKRHRELRETIFQIQRDRQLLKLRGLRERHDRISTRILEQEEEHSELSRKLESLDQLLNSNIDKVSTLEGSLADTQKTIYGLGIEREGFQDQIRFLEERLVELEARSRGCAERLRVLQEKKGVLGAQIDSRESDLKVLSGRIEEADENSAVCEKNISALQNMHSDNERRIATLSTEILTLDQRMLELQEQLQGNSDEIVRLLDARLNELGYSNVRKEQLETEIVSSLERMAIILEGRQQLLKDGTMLDSITREEYQALITDEGKSISFILPILTEVRSHFDSYRDMMPSFLSEFTSPEGVITKKRDIHRRIEDTRKKREEAREEVGTLGVTNRELLVKIEGYRSTLEDLKIARAKLSTRQKSIAESLTGLKKNLKSLDTDVIENQLEQKELEGSLGEVRERITVKQSDLKKLDGREKELRRSMSTLTSEIKDHSTTMRKREVERRGISEKIDRVRVRIAKSDTEKQVVNSEIENLYDSFSDRHSRSLREYEPLLEEISLSLEELRSALDKTQAMLRELGQVNLMAVEEYTEVKERFDFLSGQLADLEKAKEDLRSVTERIELESTRMFMESFGKIRSSFHEVFRTLFGGGKGEIRLGNSNDVLNSGIEVFAQPPGKKLENIALLSGGESALTALAVLLAIHEVRPSPFCILDEVDSAMDDSSIEKFVSLLHRFSSQSQFMLITHNKKTVTNADTLLGITMQEPGISEIVSIRMDGISTETPSGDGRMAIVEENR